jgi:hypothetical protein
MDPTSIALLIGLGTLIVDRAFAWVSKWRKSKCTNGSFEIELVDQPQTTTKV